jgi:WD40 repeat protein
MNPGKKIDAYQRMADATLTLRGHTAGSDCVAWSPDGKFVGGSGGNRVRVWEAETGREIFQPLAHAEVVYSLIWSNDGRRIITRSGKEGAPFSSNSEVTAWDAATGQKVLGVSGVIAELGFSPDLKALIRTRQDGIFTLWDLSPPKQPRTERVP